MMKTSFKERGQAKLDRLDQDDMQRLCSQLRRRSRCRRTWPTSSRRRSRRSSSTRPTASCMGDWKPGERIAQSGVGKQFSDNPANPNGANCYACHQLSKAELSFGTIGRQPLQLRQAARLHARDAEVRLRQGLQLAGVLGVLQHAALRPQRHPHRGADQGRGRAADGSGVAGQQVKLARVARRRWRRVPAVGQPATFTTKSLTPETALKAAQAALAKCRADGFQVAVAVVDRAASRRCCCATASPARTRRRRANKAWSAVASGPTPPSSRRRRARASRWRASATSRAWSRSAAA